MCCVLYVWNHPLLLPYLSSLHVWIHGNKWWALQNVKDKSQSHFETWSLFFQNHPFYFIHIFISCIHEIYIFFSTHKNFGSDFLRMYNISTTNELFPTKIEHFHNSIWNVSTGWFFLHRLWTRCLWQIYGMISCIGNLWKRVNDECYNVDHL